VKSYAVSVHKHTQVEPVETLTLGYSASILTFMDKLAEKHELGRYLLHNGHGFHEYSHGQIVIRQVIG
jgi:hypothetical protein